MVKVRKKWIIYPWFQLTLVLINLAFFLIFIGYLFYQILSSFRYMHQIGVKAELEGDHPYFSYLMFQEQLLFQELALSSGVFVVISVIFTVVLSHKIAGPMYRLQMFLEEYCQFQTRHKLSFRQTDFFQDVPDLMNRAIEIASEAKKKKD